MKPSMNLSIFYTLDIKGARPSIIEVEPFLKNKDYRGVFRVII